MDGNIFVEKSFSDSLYSTLKPPDKLKTTHNAVHLSMNLLPSGENKHRCESQFAPEDGFSAQLHMI